MIKQFQSLDIFLHKTAFAAQYHNALKASPSINVKINKHEKQHKNTIAGHALNLQFKILSQIHTCKLSMTYIKNTECFDEIKHYYSK